MTDESKLTTGRTLSVANHDRDVAGYTYVYPVVSRRAGGVSIGINLNPNNACNWRCCYCQVPNLSRGTGPALDWPKFERELHELLNAVCRGDYLAKHVPAQVRVLKDIAFSGNGEPTSSPDFCRAVRHVGKMREHFGLANDVSLVLITNGSLVMKAEVQDGLRALSSLGGEVWFKFDRGSDEAMAQTNGTPIVASKHAKRLVCASRLCRTWVQSCWYTSCAREPDKAQVDDYVHLLELAIDGGALLAGVQLYTLARKPLLSEGQMLGPVTHEWMSQLGARLTAMGLKVAVH